MKKFAIIILTVIAGLATANFALGQDQDKVASTAGSTGWSTATSSDWTANYWSGITPGPRHGYQPAYHPRYFSDTLETVEFRNVSLACALYCLNGGLTSISIDHDNIPPEAMARTITLTLRDTHYLEVLDALFKDSSPGFVVDSDRYRLSGIDWIKVTTRGSAQDKSRVYGQSYLEFQYIRDYYAEFALKNQIAINPEEDLSLHGVAQTLADSTGIKVFCRGENMAIVQADQFHQRGLNVKSLLELLERSLPVKAKANAAGYFVIQPKRHDSEQQETTFAPHSKDIVAKVLWPRISYGWNHARGGNTINKDSGTNSARD